MNRNTIVIRRSPVVSRVQAILGVILTLFIVSESWAIGGANIGNEALSARSLGQGAVGIAAENDDPATVYSNPAGMTRLMGTQATHGGTWENLHGNYTSAAGASSKMRSIDVGVPNFAFTQNLIDGKLGVGLGVESPYGLETHWQDGPLRFVATNSRIHLVDVTPGVAYQVIPMMSVGFGADYFNTFDASLEKHINVDDVNTSLGAPTAGSPEAVSRLSGSATNWGYHAGITFKPSEQHSFGLAYHSKVKLTVNGTASITGLSGASALVFGGSNYATSAFTDIFLPQNIQFGYAFKPNDKWMFEADTAWYDWWSGRELNVRYAETDPTRLAVLNSGNPEPLTQRDAWSFATGANYKATEALQVRGGFWYEPWAMPESTFTPALLDLSRYGLTAGVGYAFTPHIGVDLAYNAIFFHTRHITNTLGLTSTGDPRSDISGQYTDFANLVSLNLTFKFGGKQHQSS